MDTIEEAKRRLLRLFPKGSDGVPEGSDGVFGLLIDAILAPLAEAIELSDDDTIEEPVCESSITREADTTAAGGDDANE